MRTNRGYQRQCRNRIELTIAVALLMLACLGCGKKDDLQKLSVQMIAASGGTAAKTSLSNVIPSKPPTKRLNLVIEDERFMGDVARQLGTSVDALLVLNNMTDTLLQCGQILLVDTSREMVDQFVDKRERRKAAKLAAEESKRQDKLRKEAEVRAAKRQKLMEARAAKRGIKLKPTSLAAGTPDRGPTGVPLRAGEARSMDHGQLRGVRLPSTFAAP